MNIIKVICDICHAPLGVCDLDELRLPMTAGMFRGEVQGVDIDPFPNYRDYDQPKDIEWEHLRCRYCKKRPFILENRVQDEKENFYYITEEPTFPTGDEQPDTVYTQVCDNLETVRELYNDVTPEILEVIIPRETLATPMHKKRGRKKRR